MGPASLWPNRLCRLWTPTACDVFTTAQTLAPSTDELNLGMSLIFSFTLRAIRAPRARLREKEDPCVRCG